MHTPHSFHSLPSHRTPNSPLQRQLRVGLGCALLALLLSACGGNSLEDTEAGAGIGSGGGGGGIDTGIPIPLSPDFDDLGDTVPGTVEYTPQGALVPTPYAMAALPDLVQLLASRPNGSWVQASMNLYRDVWTPEGLRPIGANGLGPAPPSKIILAWSGFAWDARRGDVILFGGGHANYAGNDVYRWRGSTRRWERASLPSDITTTFPVTAIDGADYAPASAHTYDNNIYLPMADRFLTFGGAAYNNGGAYQRSTSDGGLRTTGPYFWNPALADGNKVGGSTGSHVQRLGPHPEIVGGQMWQNRDHTLHLAGNPSLPLGYLEGCTGYDTEDGKDVVYAGARMGAGTAMQLFRYVVPDVNQPALDQWTQIGRYFNTPQGQTVCTYDPVQKLFLRVGHAKMPFTYWNTSNTPEGSLYEYVVNFTEDSGEFAQRLASGDINVRNCGLDLDPTRRQYALWCGGAEVWMLKPPEVTSPHGWVLQKQAMAPSLRKPTADVGTGILGKWKYIPNLDAFMGLQDAVAGKIWIYKPVGWNRPSMPR